MASSVEVFFSYAPADEEWRSELEKHLSLLQRKGLISTWHNRKVSLGTEPAREIDTHLQTSQIILLLISSDFMASEYCWGVELKEAMRRHRAGTACVIPILIRPVDWKEAPFGQLQVLPRDGRAVTSWPNRDEAFTQVAEGIRQAVAEWEVHRNVTFTSSLPFLNMPHERNPLFTGREDVLERLHQALHAGKTTALTQRQAISGLGGIGKTQTAVEYAFRYQGDYQVIAWVKADEPGTLATEFSTLARLLNLPIMQEQDQAFVIESVRRWFHEHSGWLLIFDNADDLLMVKKFLPSSEKGHILLTTRSQTTGSIAQPVTLEKMPPEEGTLFLLHRSRLLDLDTPLERASPTDVAKARELVREMDGLPLALDQAAAYIEETCCSLSDYLQVYKARQADLLKRRGKYSTDHQEPVATTWSLAFGKVQQANAGAADLLRLCAYLDPDAIMEEIITKGASELGPALQKVASDPMALNDSIGELLNYSLIRRNPDHTLTIHRLVQAVIKQGMNKAMQRRWAERAVKVVNYAFPEVKYENWLSCQQYIPHALVCASLIDVWEMTFPEATNLLMQAASYLKDHADYAQAESLLQRVLDIRERVLGPDDPGTAWTLNNLAGLYGEMGRYEKAEPLYQRALDIKERVSGPDHPDTATTLNNLARLYRTAEEYKKAEPLYQRALDIYEQVLGPDHLYTATTLNNLALLYRVMGQNEKAEPFLQRAVDIVERVLGPDHPDTAATLDNLAGLYQYMGQNEKAEPLFQRALDIRERMLGSDHPSTSITLNNLALLYYVMGQYKKAEPLYQRALDINEQMRDPNHPETATTLNSLALLYRAMGQNEKAELLFQRAQRIRENRKK
jgi:tetratricopeptide (TPR) repeat protein